MAIAHWRLLAASAPAGGVSAARLLPDQALPQFLSTLRRLPRGNEDGCEFVRLLDYRARGFCACEAGPDQQLQPALRLVRLFCRHADLRDEFARRSRSACGSVV